ncbi:hydrolase [Gallibacterium genomosp. 2]|uniref:Hydrolase n=1 Tax=Gallibacterium genomosp. 2 TaxID=155517 RepID=A0A0A2XHL4_9PAST|nr:alpha/beta hydrolase [Gallibacterium genomosp. 2]KGQ31861.1 hydrolase [Gallibacterium genomosp. 2]
MNKPAIVLVHGFWGGAAHWNLVINELKKQGYTDVFAVENPLTSLQDDAERTRKMVAQIPRPVVLVGHSYGGAVISEMGNMPNVKALVYIAAFAPDVGESAGEISQKLPPQAFSAIEGDSDGYLWIKREEYHQSFCQDIDETLAYPMSITQKAPIASTFSDIVTQPAWKVKPCWYQISSQDRMIHPDNQRMMAQRMKPRKLIELDASHASLVSQVEAVSALIIDAANS